MTQPVPLNFTQAFIEDLVEQQFAHGILVKEISVNPTVLADYNKVAFAKEQILLTNSTAPASTGANLNAQWTVAGSVALKSDPNIPVDGYRMVVVGGEMAVK